MIDIVKTKEKWDSTLTEVGTYDFYHTYDYHIISKLTNENPVLVVYRNTDVLIAIPLLIRKVFDTSFYDATTVYGYAGPISKGVTNDFTNDDFVKCFNEYLEQENIVSVFGRLNPYIPQQEFTLKHLGEVKTIGNVVNIDLTKTLEEQRAAYRKDTKSRTNKARRQCTVKKAVSKEDILAFISIYNETMTKLDASNSYFFDEEYFFNFLKCDGFKTDILLAVHNESEEIIAGSMFVKTNNIVQYHLSGTKVDFMKVAPSRLLLDEMRIIATSEGFSYFNLGGGYNGNDDALFNFKSSFSNDHKQFKVWTYVVNKSVYKDLCSLSSGKDPNYFPSYRAN